MPQSTAYSCIFCLVIVVDILQKGSRSGCHAFDKYFRYLSMLGNPGSAIVNTDYFLGRSQSFTSRCSAACSVSSRFA
jgi:hypothetical protein